MKSLFDNMTYIIRSIIILDVLLQVEILYFPLNSLQTLLWAFVSHVRPDISSTGL